MSIWCSYPTIGWDNLGDPEPGWSSGEVRSYADGWSNHYPDGTAEHPGSIDLASIAPWCVPGWWERSDELDREVGPWLRLGVHSPHAVTYWRKDAEGNPTPNPEAATVVLDVAAVQALYDQLGRWLAAEKIAPAEETADRPPATCRKSRPVHQGGIMTNPAHRFASITAAADYLACEHKLIRKMIAAGKITGYRLPGSKLIRVDLNEIDALLDAGRIMPLE